MDGGGIPWALNGWRRYFLGYGWRKEHSLGTRMEEGAVTWILMEGRGKPWLKGGIVWEPGWRRYFLNLGGEWATLLSLD